MGKITGWMAQNPDSLKDGHTEKRNAISKRLLEAADDLGVNLIWKNVREIPAAIIRLDQDLDQKPDFATFWCKDTMVERLVENAGIPCFNPSGAIEACDDKMRTWFLLDQANLPQPDSIPVPRTWLPTNWEEEDFVDDVAAFLGYPMIGKDNCGSFGAEVAWIENREALVSWINDRSLQGKDCLVQRCVPESHGKDLRLYVVGDEVVAAMERRNLSGDFRANISGGGIGIAHEPTDEEAYLAIKAAQACSCAWAGVDLLLSDNGPVICEVNSNAHFIGLEQATGRDVAKAIIGQCIKELERRI